MPVSEKRIAELDGLRGIAILLVLLWHFTGMLVDPAQGDVQYLAWRYLIFGRTGVDLFFVLSGFLIIGILIDNRDSPDYFTTFYARRALRLLPPYLILLGGCWLLFEVSNARAEAYFGRELPLWSLLTFTQNWVMASINSYGATLSGGTWSLAIEEQFYLFAPLLILVLPPRWLIKALVAVGTVSLVARSAYFHLHPEHVLAPYVVTVFRLDGLCAGGVIAIAYRHSAMWSAIVLRRKALLTALAILIAILPFYTWSLRSDFGPLVEYDFGHAYLALLYGLILTSALVWSGKPSTAWLRGKNLTAVGAISYSLYLFHPSFKALFFVLARRGEQLTSPIDIALLSAAIISTFVFCALLYRYVERPAQKSGHRFRYDVADSYRLPWHAKEIGVASVGVPPPYDVDRI
jgi:peptidoglycan/LPS O-acetylase OafA/YrhL